MELQNIKYMPHKVQIQIDKNLRILECQYKTRIFFYFAQKAAEKTFLSIVLKASNIPVTNIKQFLMSLITNGKLKLLAVINFKRKVLKFNPLQSHINLSYIHRLFQS